MFTAYLFKYNAEEAKDIPTNDSSLVSPANKADGSFCGDRNTMVANIFFIVQQIGG